MRRVLLLILITVTLVLSSLPQPMAGAAGAAGVAELSGASAGAAPYTVAYTLTITGKNQADIAIKVTGAPDSTTDLNGESMGSGFPAMGAVAVTDGGGQTLPSSWTGQRGRTLRVQNGSAAEFTVRYPYDALRTIGPQYQQVVFEPATVLFIADNVFLVPSAEPSRITARVIPPEGTKVFASLPEDPEENGQFVATKDLWGDLRYDFGKAYFTGGNPLFVLDHRTAWGDLYRYIWFDRDAVGQMWLPSYGDTPWEEAEAYMAMTERLAKYEREHVMGPLPPHVVLFTDVRRTENQSHSVMSNTDFFHYMQIWPRDSEGEVAHHVLHAYTFHFQDQSKMSLEAPGFRNFLKEGLPTYIELTAPAALSGDDRTIGKVFEFWALEQRGRPFGIQRNLDYHVKYNQSTTRVYLLDRYIQRVTGGQKDITDFTRAMWDVVKDRRAPAEFTEADALGAFASVVGAANQDYIKQVDALTDFPAADFAPLLPAFKEHVQWMADRWFGGSQLLFLAYLDVVAAKGGNWPHYATFPHQVPFKLREAMSPFWQYLRELSGAGTGAYTQADVLAALKASTGQDHPGFFEFWSAQGFSLDPNSLRSVGNWDPDASSEGDWMPLAFETKGSLEMEHNLAGVPQQATAVLDAPAPGSTVDIQVALHNPERVPPMEEARAALAGDNVTLLNTELFDWRGVTYVRAMFKVTTTDPERRRFPLTLTLPAALSYPDFRVLRPENVQDRDLGTLYFLPPIAPVSFEPTIDAAARKLTLPAVGLKGARFVISGAGTGSGAGAGADSGTVQAVPGETVLLKGTAPQIGIDLVDGYGFLRGRQSVSVAPAAGPPTQPGPPPNGEIRVTLDGRLLTFDVPPANVSGRVLVPLRAIAEALDAVVGWDGAAQRVTLTRGGHVVALAVGEQQATLDGQTITLDVAPILRDDRTLVPVRFISQSLGATVNWDGVSQTVIIVSGH